MTRNPAQYGNPILPGSSPEILRPMETKHGILQVIPIDELEVHALRFTSKTSGYTHTITMHANGYSVHELAMRIINAWNDEENRGYRTKRAIEQFVYIADCGGLTSKSIDWLFELED